MRVPFDCLPGTQLQVAVVVARLVAGKGGVARCVLFARQPRSGADSDDSEVLANAMVMANGLDAGL